jgi:nitrogenase molybdenum-iron protein alpha/beta subunit
MAKVQISKKACTVNPLKMSQPIGGALAFLGIKNCMPLLHGSQGCTSFGLVLRAPFPRSHPDADNGHERGRDRARRI